MEMSARILVVEDEPAIKALIVANLLHAGFTVLESADAESAWAMVMESAPDVILIDWMLPGVSGYQLVRHIRADARIRDLPVIMLTARVDEVDKIAALEAGVDDYVTKPFSPRELVARIKAVLRRHRSQANLDLVEAGGLSMIPASRKASVRGIGVVLGPIEFRLLHFLMSHSERVYSRRQLLDHVWGERSYIEERTIDVHIRRLRSTLEQHECASLVQTVRGLGYRFSTSTDS